jgi:acyl-CoA synthetase (AMP-forming)/AMP-acid ligase II
MPLPRRLSIIIVDRSDGNKAIPSCGPRGLAARIIDAQAKLVITADAGMRAGKFVPLKQLVDEAWMETETNVEHVLVVHRGLQADLHCHDGRDLLYSDLAADVAGATVEPEWLESSEASYILYTSGTTAKPKGVQRDVGGYAVALASSIKHLFGGKLGESIFCTGGYWVGSRSFLLGVRTAGRFWRYRLVRQPTKSNPVHLAFPVSATVQPSSTRRPARIWPEAKRVCLSVSCHCLHDACRRSGKMTSCL